MSKIRILYTLNEARMAGTERHVLYLLKNLDRELFEPHVVCFSKGPLIEMLRKQRIDARALPRKRFLDFPAAKRLFDLIKETKIDLVHSHCGHFSFWVAKIAGVRHLIETRHGLYFNYDELDHIRPVTYWINKAKASFVNLTLTVNTFDKQLLIEKFNIPERKIEAVLNGIDLEDLNDAMSPTKILDELKIRTRAPVVGTVARFTEQKGLRYFVESIPLIRTKFPDTQFVIVGDGEQRSELVRVAEKHQVLPNILFTGYRENAISIMSIFDVFVLPSLWEGTAYTILEAMALKLPVVATAVFGNREVVVDGETGYLVEPRNSAQIAEAVIKLLTDRQKAKILGENGFKRIERLFSAKEMTRKIEQIYLELLNGQK
jgi:glycosyltransferase involved in cell wall biosynthesis